MASEGIHAALEKLVSSHGVTMKIASLAQDPCDFLCHQVRSLCPYIPNMMPPTLKSSPEVKYIRPLTLNFALQNYELKKTLFSTTYLSYSVVATENRLMGIS